MSTQYDQHSSASTFRPLEIGECAGNEVPVAPDPPAPDEPLGYVGVDRARDWPAPICGVKAQSWGVSERALSLTLKDIEADGFVLRTAHAVVPPRVDYELTTLGQGAAKHIVALATWIESALPEILPRKAVAKRAGNASSPVPRPETKLGRQRQVA